MALLLLSVGTSAFQPPPPAVEARVQGLLKAMSNAEKARQLDMYSGRDFLSNGRFNATKASAVLGGGLGVGRIHDLYAQDPAVANCVDTNGPRGLCTVPKAPCVSYIPEAQGTLPPPRPQALYAHQPRACRT